MDLKVRDLTLIPALILFFWQFT